jgi:hypothetical protein
MLFLHLLRAVLLQRADIARPHQHRRVGHLNMAVRVEQAGDHGPPAQVHHPGSRRSFARPQQRLDLTAGCQQARAGGVIFPAFHIHKAAVF